MNERIALEHLHEADDNLWRFQVETDDGPDWFVIEVENSYLKPGEQDVKKVRLCCSRKDLKAFAVLIDQILELTHEQD